MYYSAFLTYSRLNFSDPTLLSLGNRTFNPDYDVFEYDYVNEWSMWFRLPWKNPAKYLHLTSISATVYIVIIGNNKTIDLPDVSVVTASHPIHLHGHDFAILGTGPDKYDELRDPLKFNYHNPPRRDVALLPSGGWLAIAFRSDNPGVWLLHCHIAWHASSGLALQILERRKEILDDLGPQRVAAVERTCTGWDQWLKGGEVIDQEDSGMLLSSRSSIYRRSCFEFYSNLAIGIWFREPGQGQILATLARMSCWKPMQIVTTISQFTFYVPNFYIISPFSHSRAI